MPLYPIPAVVALVGWLFVFGTSDWLVLAYGAGTLAGWASPRSSSGTGSSRTTRESLNQNDGQGRPARKRPPAPEGRRTPGPWLCEFVRKSPIHH